MLLWLQAEGLATAEESESSVAELVGFVQDGSLDLNDEFDRAWLEARAELR